MTKTEGGCTLALLQGAVEVLWGKLLGRPSLHTLGCLKGLKLVFFLLVMYTMALKVSVLHAGTHTNTHAHTFSMGCMRDYIYCTKSSWS